MSLPPLSKSFDKTLSIELSNSLHIKHSLLLKLVSNSLPSSLCVFRSLSIEKTEGTFIHLRFAVLSSSQVKELTDRVASSYKRKCLFLSLFSLGVISLFLICFYLTPFLFDSLY